MGITFEIEENYLAVIFYHTTVAMPLYLGLVLSVSGESPCSMVFLLLLLACCSDGCCCSIVGCGFDSDSGWGSWGFGACFWSFWRICWACCCRTSEFSIFSAVPCFWSFDLVFFMWGLSLFKSDSLTGFKKNSSAPSSKHLVVSFRYSSEFHFKNMFIGKRKK